MKRRLFPGLAAVLVLSPLLLAAAPEMMEPGDAQRKLDFLVGEWDVLGKAYMGDSVHEAVHRTVIDWLPGGVWLEEKTDLEMPSGPIFGSARIAWDKQAGEYVRYWMDNQSVVSLSQRGRFVNEHTLEFKGSFTWIDGTTFHQRLVIENDPVGGWKQTGYMGRDPEALRLNHEGTAVPVAHAAAPAPGAKPLPNWLENHMRFLTQDGGRWITDNSKYRSDDEPFDSYGVDWKWGLGRKSITGRLFGLVGGEEKGTFWEFRTVWHPGTGRAMAYQFGGNGIFGEGVMEPAGAGQTKMEQVFYALDGNSFKVGHESSETPEKTHRTKSFDVQPDGTWKPKRTYTWHLEPGPGS